MYYTGIGSRKTPADMCARMTRCANILERAGYCLRSGGADGADLAFEKGVVDPKNKEIWHPFLGFNKKSADPHRQGVWIPTIGKMRDAEEIASRIHPAWHRCSQVARELHARNVFQVLGVDFEEPSEFVVYWAPMMNGEPTGGTRTAVVLAQQHDIPTFNMWWDVERRAFNEWWSNRT